MGIEELFGAFSHYIKLGTILIEVMHFISKLFGRRKIKSDFVGVN